MKYREFPVGHPVIITVFLSGEVKDIHNKYKGLFQCQVLPPKNLYIPLLPYRTNGKLVFPLCKKCADESIQTSCNHSDSDRSFIGVFTHVELRHAINSLGYKILKVFEVWHWEKFKSDMFSSYIDNFFKIKESASGFPSHVTTDTDKDNYIKKVQEEEGITLQKEKVKKSPGMRALAKLMLNRYVLFLKYIFYLFIII